HNAIMLEQRVIVAIGMLVLILLCIAWLRRGNRRLVTVVPLLAAAGALAFAPFGSYGLENLFSPALFLLPLPVEVSLGTLLSVLIALAALAASVRASKRMPRLPMVLLAVGAVVVALGYPGAIRLLVGPGAAVTDLQRAAGSDLLLGGAALWFGLQVAAVLLLGIVTELVLPRWNWTSPLQVSTRVRSPWLLMLIGALASSAGLSIVVLLIGQTRTWISPWLAAAWCLPFLLAGFAMAAYRGGGVRLIRWVTAGWLAASAVLPYMWVAHVDARLNAAERDLRTLGATNDPYLEYSLMQFAREAKLRAQTGETGYQLLWRSWLASGLAGESYPARLTLWSRDGVAEVPLSWNIDEMTSSAERIGVPYYLQAGFARVREYPDSSELMRVQAVPDVNEVLILSPDSNQILTVEVAPRRSLDQPDLPFLGRNTHADTRVELAVAREPINTRTWVPSENGWRSETLVHYADGDYHAHMEVRMPRMGVRVARGVLLLAFDLVLFTILWLIGRAARGEHLAVLRGWRQWRGSFRARVTATLFFFFLVPTAVFGLVAFRALTREVTRATRMVAERAVQQAVVEFKDSGGNLRDLANRAAAQVLYYFQGELAGTSAPEARDLGIYGAWMPADVYLALTRSDEDEAVRTGSIAGQDVLTAYRSLVPSGTLAVPMPLQSGETAIRQAELAHLILFAALMGGLLSLLLSVVVGRALTGPINRLAGAAAQVGSGNLRVRLPEDTGDEFGQLYASFNRMVRRLRRARVQERRTARVLAWGEMARQVAHEIKNPLTPIKLAVQHLRRAYNDRNRNFGGILESNVDQILLEIDRLSEIARAFSRYGAPAASTGPLEPIDIQQVIHEALTLYRAGDPDVAYQEDVEINVPHALGRSGELKEVLLNLLENARSALDGKAGLISVSARSNHEQIELAVKDNGPGIPSDFLPRVFEPHFSTRTTGTGLGLAIVRRLVESWGGTVTAESDVGKGTTIRITLRKA
ncbi:MAG TPA: HAMP domain-containing sensor histidine kinase, partial [Longimicrobiales bacterium]